MSHWTDGARRQKIVVHHRGACGLDSDPACTHCWERKSHPTCDEKYKLFYDFCIARSGSYEVSWDDKHLTDPGSVTTAPCGATVNPPCISYPFYKNTTGGAVCGGNCDEPNNPGWTSVMMQRCYGGCSGCTLTEFNDPQLCALAYISLHLGITAEIANHITHRKASALNPCGDSGCGTVCPGTHLTSDSTTHGWNATGTSLMSRMLWMRNNLASGCDCTGQIC